MKLLDLVFRQSPPEPWAEGEKIPWNDPEFSQRMLREHLSQEHDAASRRFAIIDRHVDWIHRHLLDEKPAKVLDLGCGPGLYASRLARLGHECVGIDFSPASIAYAQKEASQEGLACHYVEADIRKAAYGTGYDLAMSIFGELNVFRPEDAKLILQKAHAALKEGGQILLEPHTFAAVQMIGESPATWYTAKGGLFTTAPHLCLQENFWDAAHRVAITRYFVVDALTDEIERHSASVQAYTEGEYKELLEGCGFSDVTFYPSLSGEEDAEQKYLIAVVARKGSV